MGLPHHRVADGSCFIEQRNIFIDFFVHMYADLMSKENKLDSPGFSGRWMLEIAFSVVRVANSSTPFASVQFSYVLLPICTGEEQGAVLLLGYLMQN